MTKSSKTCIDIERNKKFRSISDEPKGFVLKQNKQSTNVQDYYFTWRMTFCMLCIMILFLISAYVMCADMINVPRFDDPRFHELNPDHIYRFRTIEGIWGDFYPERRMEWNMGDGFMSNLESAVMLGSGFLGFMRLIDLLIMFIERDNELAFAFFAENMLD